MMCDSISVPDSAASTIKQRALELIAQVSTRPGRYRPSDAVLAFLESL
jgi:hypothetical protein